MSGALARPMSLAEFLDWEQVQEARYEFDGQAPRLMTGGTFEHSEIATNLVEVLRRRLRPPCRAVRGDVKILAAGDTRAYYPDAVVTCAPVPRGALVIPEPVVVFEVLSPSTTHVDRYEKNRAYLATPSIRHYVILEQDRLAATVLTRAGDHRSLGVVDDPGASIAQPEKGVEVPLAEIYAGIELPPDPAATAASEA
jgi:Uma2 family endonuclease